MDGAGARKIEELLKKGAEDLREVAQAVKNAEDEVKRDLANPNSKLRLSMRKKFLIATIAFGSTIVPHTFCLLFYRTLGEFNPLAGFAAFREDAACNGYLVDPKAMAAFGLLGAGAAWRYFTRHPEDLAVSTAPAPGKKRN